MSLRSYLALFGFVFGLWMLTGLFINSYFIRRCENIGEFEFGFVLHFSCLPQRPQGGKGQCSQTDGKDNAKQKKKYRNHAAAPF
jgi:hypothetical protein